jgi:hypothetical protein
MVAIGSLVKSWAARITTSEVSVVVMVVSSSTLSKAASSICPAAMMWPT